VKTVTKHIVDDLEALLAVIPPYIAEPLYSDPAKHELLEVIMDLGRPPEARFPHHEKILNPREITFEDIEYVLARIGSFSGDNRAGIERTLHRISAIRNRQGRIIGLTLRVGRAVFGTIKIIEDLIASGKNILLLGRPGVGKTTMLREAARVLADDFRKRVIIVDTSNEIAGDGDIPHPAIGRARRMQVPTPTMQHAVMIEAVENHMPEVIVVDEIGTELEAAAARTIAERGVQLIATAHGNTLDNLILNPTLCDLIGGIQVVTLSDEEARRRGTQKSVLERKAPPTFDILVEIQEWDRVAVHPDVASTVDALLRGKLITPEVRSLEESGEVRRERQLPTPSHTWPTPQTKPLRVYPYGINLQRLEDAIKETQAPVTLVGNVDRAEIVITSKAFYRRHPSIIKQAENLNLPVYVLRNSNPSQIKQCLRALTTYRTGGVEAALKEVEQAAARVASGSSSVELSPQSAYIRRLQHQLAEHYGLSSRSLGEEPLRRVVVYKG